MKRPCKERSLAFLNPKLAKEWDYEKNYPLIPEDVTRHSHKTVWWKCSKGHSYDVTVGYRSKGIGCPYCSGHRVDKNNSLATVSPGLVAEWDYKKNYPLTPQEIFARSNKTVWWKCSKGHRYEAIISRRSVSGHGCPYCSGHRVDKCNCLQVINPKLSKEWDYKKNYPLTPSCVLPHSNKKVWWKCSMGHSYKADMCHRSMGRGCPYCDGKQVCIDNCLSTLSPELAREWNYEKNIGLTPFSVVGGSHKKVWWKCNVGHIWKMSIHNRYGGSGCPYCNKIILKDGTFCDSLSEAYYYLGLKSKSIKFVHSVKIGLGRCVCDFYIPSTNKYIEVTGFNNKWKHWVSYHKNILRKKVHITQRLKANFEFVKIKLTPKQVQYVRENVT